MRLYFVNSNGWSLANITLLGNAEIHQLADGSPVISLIPEPQVVMFWLCSAVTLYAARRRKR
jgi:hypothetical protein